MKKGKVDSIASDKVVVDWLKLNSTEPLQVDLQNDVASNQILILENVRNFF